MAKRIKWDKYETALLIDAFWSIEYSPEKKKNIIEELSKDLRTRASNLGLEIDDIFRNTNGISMQLAPIAHAFFPDRPTLTTSALFEEMVEMYKTDRLAFDDILNIAKKQIHGFAGEIQTIIVPTPSLEDNLYLPDRLFAILKKESSQNKYGSTLYYLSSLAKASQENVKTILDSSEWARYQYGRYYFVFQISDEEREYSFSNPQSLACSRPTRLLYFEELISEAKTWRQLYIDFMKVIYEDYPNLINDIVRGDNVSTSSPLVGDITNLKQFKTPGEFAPGLIVELDRSASDIVNCIERLLELCNVDCENVRIFFERKEISDGNEKAKISFRDSKVQTMGQLQSRDSIIGERRYIRDDKEAFYRWLKDHQKLDDTTAEKYVSAIRKAEEYAIKSISSSCKLYCNDKGIISSTASALFSDAAFKEKNEQKKNRFFLALREYLSYMNVPKLDYKKPDNNVAESAFQKENAENEKIIYTLVEHFVYGFNFNSPIEMMRFRAQYETDHNEPCTLDDEDLKKIVAKHGLLYNGKIYIVSHIGKERIRELFCDRIKAGDTIFYFDEVYSANEEWLYDEHIVDSEMLKLLVESLFPNYQYKERYFIVHSGRITELNAIKEALLHSWGEQILHTFAELRARLPFIPLDKIRYALSYAKEFTWNSLETYARNDLFKASNDQINEIIDFVREKCIENGSVTFEELPLEDLAAENYELSESALYDIVFSYFPESFSRNGKVISHTSEQQLDTIAAIQQYCQQHERCTMTDLQQIMKHTEGSVRYPVIIEAASNVMVRVSQEEFVSDEIIQFDIQGIDRVLEDVVGNGIGLKEVTTFGAFPFCGYSWNLFILESYCRRFSQKYKYACLTPNSQNAGAIIPKKSDLSYHDIMAEALAKSGVELTEKEAFDYLLSSGLLIRRRYHNMSSLLKEAADLREGGN